MKIKIKILLLTLLIAPLCFLAQDPYILVEGKVSNSSGAKISGVSITVKKNGSSFKNFSTASNGKYKDVQLPMGAIYEVTYSAPGYVSKTLKFDAKTGYFPEDVPEVTPFDIPIELFEEKPDVDYSIVTDQPIGGFKVDPASGVVAPDAGYNSSRKAKVNKFLSDLEKQEDNKEKEFKDLIAAGDKSVANGNYQAGIDSYNKALAIKEDTGVQGKLDVAEKKLATKKSFDQLVTDGDQSLASENYDGAIKKYQEAKALLPEDKNIDKLIQKAQDAKAAAENAELDKAYTAKMAEAKKALDEEDYAYAKTLYADAGDIKPDELEPPKKIKEIDKLIADQLANDQKYNEYVSAGDQAMMNEDYAAAIENYEGALSIKPDESHPKSELEKAKKLQAEKDKNEAAKAEFDKLIEEGDGNVASEDYEGGIAKYKEAKALNVDNSLADDRIQAAKDAQDKEAAAELQEQFNELIASGDAALGSENFDAAIQDYEKAKALNVDNSAAEAKIQAAKDAKKAKEEADKLAELQTQFNELVALGDKKLMGEEYDAAIENYIEAKDLGVDNATAEAKIQAANEAKNEANKNAQQAEFNELISAGDEFVTIEDFDNAISKYEAAKTLNVDNATADAKIAAAKDAKKAKEEADQQAELKKQFDEYLQAGDNLLASKDFDGAIGKYEQAKGLDFDNATADAKIQAANDAKNNEEIAEKQTQFNNLISSGDGKLANEDYAAAITDYQEALALEVDNATANAKIQAAEEAQEKANKEAASKAKFEELIAAGDGKLESESFDDAIAKYQEALALDYDNATAEAKISKAKADKEAKNNAKAAALKEEFDNLIASGDNLLDGSDYESAITNYEQALALDYDNTTAQNKIDKATAAKEAANDAAKAQQRFTEYMNAGQGKLDGKDFTGAIADFESAKALNIDNAAAQSKIDEAKAAQAEALAKQGEQENQEKFNSLISLGESKEGALEFDDAIAKYQEAKSLDVNNDLAQQKIDAANKAKEDYLATQKDEEKQKEFDALIAQGDDAKDQEDWDKAKELYGKAHGVINESPIPQQKIDEVKDLMKQQSIKDQDALFNKVVEKVKEFRDKGNYEPALGIIAKQKNNFPDKTDVLNALEQEIKELKAKEDKYSSILAEADGLFEQSEWKQARAKYVAAKKMFDRDRPTNQIKLIDAKLAELANQPNEEELKLKEYKQLMAEAADLYDSESYEDAISKYQAAQTVLPEKPEPAQKIKEIKDLLAELAADEKNAALQAKYDAVIEKADAKRDEAIAAEDRKLGVAAKDLYKEANSILPDEDYPQEEVDNLNNLMQNWIDPDILAQYKKRIALADDFFDKKEWDQAEKHYSKAIELMPSDDYPPAQLKKIAAARKGDAERGEYNEIIAKANENFDTENWVKSRKLYQKALGIKPKAPLPAQKIKEIDDILAKLKKEQEMADAAKSAVPDINPWGEPLVGTSEDEVDAIFKDQEIDRETDKVEAIKKVKEDYQEEFADETEYQKNSTDDVNEINTIRQSQYAENQKDLDVPRQTKNIPAVEDYKAAELEREDSEKTAQVNYTDNNNEVYAERATDRSEWDSGLDERREAYIPDVEEYKESNSELNNGWDGQNENATYENYEAKEALIKKYEKLNEDLDAPRRNKNIPTVENYKENHQEASATIYEKNIDKVDGNSDEYRDLNNRISDFTASLDVPREDVILDLEQYKEDQLGLIAEEKEDNIERTDKTYNAQTELKEDIFDQFENEDETRQENIDKLKDYKESVLDEKKKEKEEHVDENWENTKKYEKIKNQKPTMFSDQSYSYLANSYDQGVTEEMYHRKDAEGEIIEVTIIRIVVEGSNAYMYRKVKTQCCTNYFKNDQPVSAHIWDTETH